MNNITGRLEKEEKSYAKIENKLKSLPSIFSEYYVSMRANRKSYTTINTYLDDALHFVRFATKGNMTDDFYKHISSYNVEEYMISLERRQTKDGIKRTGDDILQTRWSALNCFFSWLVKRGHIDTNPILMVDRPKNQTEHKVVYLTKVEINKLYKAISNNPSEVMALRDKTFVALALSTALRISAILNINIDNIDFDNNTISVIEKRQKVRSISFGEQTKRVLQEWISVRNEAFDDVDTTALFLSQKKNRLSEDAVSSMLDKYCKEAGIKRITPHKLRATASCMMAKNNIPVKAIAKQLGHAQIATTMRYIDVFNEDEEKAMNVLDGLVQ